jgi:hypothetical protein
MGQGSIQTKLQSLRTFQNSRKSSQNMQGKSHENKT